MLLDAEDTEEKFRKLYQMANDFVFAGSSLAALTDTATSYAKIIISELCVPTKDKLIKPIEEINWRGALGLAGGQK